MKKNELKTILKTYQYNKDYIYESSNNIKIEREYTDKYLKNLPINYQIDDNISTLIEKHKNNKKSVINIINNNKYIEDIINSLEQPYKNVLFYKYINNLSFGEIALKMNYSTPRIYQLHNKALDLAIKNNKEDLEKLNKNNL